MTFSSQGKSQATDFLHCSHCGNFAPMNIIGSHYLSTRDPEAGYMPDEGYTHQLLLCLACSKVTLTKRFFHEDMDPEYDDFKSETLYPRQEIDSSCFPWSVQAAYQVALKTRRIDPNAYAILLGRILEVICEDRKVQGRDLNAKLKILAEKGEIPSNLVGIADGLRSLRNIGAHQPLNNLTHDEIPILDALSNAILEYIYVAPRLASQAQQLANRLKKKPETQITKSDPSNVNLPLDLENDGS
jgi:Domain of unknown function (DUF4145)